MADEAPRRLYVKADKTTLVEEGDPDAAFFVTDADNFDAAHVEGYFGADVAKGVKAMLKPAKAEAETKAEAPKANKAETPKANKGA